MPENPLTLFTSLSWNDLEQWAGETILERGKNYRRRVHDLEMTESGNLVATVAGRDSYVTQVWIHNGEVNYDCSCPYWGPCKHAVAVVLVYLDRIKSGDPPPQIAADELEARLSVYGVTDEVEKEDDSNLSSTHVDKAHKTLKGMTKAQLIKWIMPEVVTHPSLLDSLPLTSPLSGDTLKKAIARTRQQIRKTTDERGWQNHWNGEGYTPDYSGIQRQLNKLLDGGHSDTVLELGEELLSLGTTQVEESDDDGETAYQLSDSLAVVLEAMRKSDRLPAERMIWYWDKLLADDYALFDQLEPPIKYTDMNKLDWSQVAEEFTQRLASYPKQGNENGWSSASYHRGHLLEYTLEALLHSGQDNRALELMIEELPYSHNYLDLVKYLVKIKSYDQAQYWAKEGFRCTIEKLPGIAWDLVEQLLGIARQRKDWPGAAALNVETFLYRTSTENYKLTKTACKKAKCWTAAEPKLMQYLETGKSPISARKWPLPATELKYPKSPYSEFPAYDDLIDIALYEKRNDEALKWFQQAPDKSFHADAIAWAVQKKHPDVSLEIWQNKIEMLIAKVKPAAYRDAMPYLKKMKKLKQSIKQNDSYQRYVLQLRSQHKAKKRLMQELDKIEGTGKGKKNQRILDDL